jgi:hypothetical protein
VGVENRARFSLGGNSYSTTMPYYECPTCGGGYVIEPAVPHPKCDRDGATLKRASEASYTLHEREDKFEMPAVKPATKRPKS